MTELPPQIIRPRHLEPEVIAALGDRRAVLIGGARQAGKTTLAEMALRARRNYRFRPACLPFGVHSGGRGTAGRLVGTLLESFEAMELRRQLGWSSRHARLHHFHNRDGAEVALLLEASDGQVVGIEVKASLAVRSEDFRGLRFLAERTGDKFRAGIVLYTGAEELSSAKACGACPWLRCGSPPPE
jgi:predicted AAA+ superfamily ATPase